jgi:hypothetical protein
LIFLKRRKYLPVGPPERNNKTADKQNSQAPDYHSAAEYFGAKTQKKNSPQRT